MSVTAKICGLTTPQTVTAALDGGASHLGFMFFAKSPRNIEPEMAARLTPPARAKNAKIVAVTVDPDDALVEQLAATLKPDFIQLHGKETPARARQVALRSGAGVIKVISVSSAHDIDTARPYESVVDHLMFDAKPPSDHPLPGGAGARFDWTLLAGRRFERPWFLAGGLDPWNVGEAVRLSGAPLVDVSSGVERGPGLKDPALIVAFLDAVRRA
ncbi:phosphoribosylanthranilate isomerase [Phenylobacterium sp. LH3H17]|uniref:phosphoribosylanthranilate isomerase n=1 Tax=Phenylobacterium sp. LH3H17 TaxID=2903901 RepID=UPI0020C9E701|nr:phosphoribosylanthranilate isomerase [Phenylobacterium sp. LH3H17]UTP39907.1 phosphoribosylanthranilate isomerase [Phenylobacterium sp. LH3H17]